MSSQCVVCLNTTMSTDHAVIPCGHLCMCSSCAITCKTSLSACPICRNKFTDITKIFFCTDVDRVVKKKPTFKNVCDSICSFLKINKKNRVPATIPTTIPLSVRVPPRSPPKPEQNKPNEHRYELYSIQQCKKKRGSRRGKRKYGS